MSTLIITEDLTSVTEAGIVQLIDSVESESMTMATTANAVKVANDNANTRILKTSISVNYTDLSSITVASSKALAEGLATKAMVAHSHGIDELPLATLEDFGVTKLETAIDSDSEELAATPKSVKLANDNANTKIAKASITDDFTADSGTAVPSALALSTGLATKAEKEHSHGADDIQVATESNYGVTKLMTSVDSTSVELAATPKSVKLANDNANTRILISNIDSALDSDSEETVASSKAAMDLNTNIANALQESIDYSDELFRVIMGDTPQETLDSFSEISAQFKENGDLFIALTTEVGTKVAKSSISNSVTSSSSTTVASSKAVKIANALAASKQTKAEADALYLKNYTKATLIDNDAFGDANLVFNHKNGIPLQDGSAGRISVTTDGPKGEMSFHVTGAGVEGDEIEIDPTLVLTNGSAKFNKPILDTVGEVFGPANRNITSSISSTSSTLYSSAAATRLAYNLAASKMTQATGDSRYVNVTGDTMNGPLRINKTSDGAALRLLTESSGSTDIYLEIGDGGGNLGYLLKYWGTGSGNDNDFSIESTTKTLLRSGQDGIINFAQLGTTIAGHKVWHAGNDGGGSGLAADTTETLRTARTISLTGDASGGVSFNGSKSVSIPVVVANDSHTHDTRYYTKTQGDGRYLSNLRTTTTYYTVPDLAWYASVSVGHSIMAKADSAGLPIATNGYLLKIGARDSGGGSSWIFISDYAGVGSILYYGTTQTNSTGPIWKRAVDTAFGDGRYLAIGAKAVDSNKLDGLDSSQFIRSDVDDVKTSGALTFNDNIYLRFGTGSDAEIFHNGSNLYTDINNGGNWYLRDGNSSNATRFTFDIDAGNLTATNFIGALSGNASTATKLKTARTISLVGDATGSTTFDGSGNVTLSPTINKVELRDGSNGLTTATSGTARWNDLSNLPFSIGANNNLAGMWLHNGNTENSRTLNIQVGHNAGTYAGVGGTINLNPFAGAVQINGHTAWHAGNDGSGSGLDADKLDGLNSSSFIRSDADDTKTGLLQMQDNALLKFGTGGDVEQWWNGTNFYTDINGGGNWYIRDGNSSNAARFSFDIDAGNLIATTFTGKLTGNASSATKLATARTISLTGDASGSVSFDGTKNVSLSVAIGANNHDHNSQYLGLGGGTLTGDLTIRHSTANTSSKISLMEGDSHGTIVSYEGIYNTFQLIGVQWGVHKVGLSQERAVGINDLKYIGNQVWHAGNDGAGSGLAADTTETLRTARTISLSGDASGSVSFNGSKNVAIPVVVANDSHTHDGRYYTESESDARYVNVTGDTLTGVLNTKAIRAVSTPKDPFRWQRTSNSQVAQDDNVSVHLDDNRIYFKNNNGSDGGAGAFLFQNTNTDLTISDMLSISRSGLSHMGYEVWHAGNDGSGSGLDADKLDGISSSQFLRSDVADTLNAALAGSDNKPLLQINGTDTAYLGSTGRNNLTLASINNPIWKHTSGDRKLFNDVYHPNADKLTTARTISLTGDASGSVAFDGSANKSIAVVVANDSHTHDGRYYTESESNTRFAYKAGAIAQSFSTKQLHVDTTINYTKTASGLVWVMNTDYASIKFHNTSDSDLNSRLEFAVGDNANEFFSWTSDGVQKMTLKQGVLNVDTVVAKLTGNASTATWADTVDVNGSNTSSTFYDVVWHSSDTLYSSSGVEIQGSTNTLRASNLSAKTALRLGNSQEASIQYNATDKSIDFIIG